MKIVFGLGNPGGDYNGTRHNIGFGVVDRLAAQHKASFVEKTKFKALVAEYNNGGEKVLLVKPATFYNEVGTSARALIDFYKLDSLSDLLAVHDDLALPLGMIRTREKGSDAGNNGIKSLNAHLGHDYSRLRIGIGSELRDRIDDVNFVLGRFNHEEVNLLEPVLEKAVGVAEGFTRGTFEVTSHS